MLISVAFAAEEKAEEKNVQKRGLVGLSLGGWDGGLGGYGGYGGYGGLGGLGYGGLDGGHGWANDHTKVITKTLVTTVPKPVAVAVPVDRPYPVKVRN